MVKNELREAKKFVKQIRKIDQFTIDSISSKYILFDHKLRIKESFDIEEFTNRKKIRNKHYTILDGDIINFINGKTDSNILYRKYYTGHTSQAFYTKLHPIYKNDSVVGYLLILTDNTEEIKKYDELKDMYENRKEKLEKFKTILIETIMELTETKSDLSKVKRKYDTLLNESECLRQNLNYNKKELAVLRTRFSNMDKLIEALLDKLYAHGIQVVNLRNFETNIKKLLESQEKVILDFPNNLENFNLNADEINRILENEDSEIDQTLTELLNNTKKFEQDIIFIQNNFYKVRDSMLNIIDEFPSLVSNTNKIEEYVHKLSNLVQNL